VDAIHLKNRLFADPFRQSVRSARVELAGEWRAASASATTQHPEVDEMTTHAKSRLGAAARRPLGFFFGLAAAILVTAALFARPPRAQAFSSYLSAFELQYPAAMGSRIDACVLCHTTTSGGPLNAYGTAYGANGHSFTAIESMDSDGDGAANITEIRALTYPGNAADVPAQPPTSTQPPTATATAIPPTPTPTATAPAPTATTAGPTAVPSATSVPPTPGGPGLLDIRAFAVTSHVTLGGEAHGSVWLWLIVKKSGAANGQGTANITGLQNGVKVYDLTIAVSSADRNRGRYFLPRYRPTAAGTITWTVTLDDGDPDLDVATAATDVTAGQPSDDHETQQATARPQSTEDGDHGQPTTQPQPTGINVTPQATQAPAAQPPSGDDNTQAAGACTGTHVVAAGENLFRIGYNCGFSLQQMAAANGIGWPYQIHAGQTLRFP
jgi:hypothetical protein